MVSTTSDKSITRHQNQPSNTNITHFSAHQLNITHESYVCSTNSVLLLFN
jgi:hypothetical protein